VFAHYLFLSGLRLLQTSHYVATIIKSPLQQAGLSSARRALLVPAAAKEDAACNDALITCLLHKGWDHLFVSNKLFEQLSDANGFQLLTTCALCKPGDISWK